MPSSYEPLGQDAPDDYFHAESSTRVNTAFAPKPEAYYGEGPFDPPSSDDESEVLLEKSVSRGSGVFEDEGHLILGSSEIDPSLKERPASLKFLIFGLAILVSVSIAVVIGVFAARSYTGTPFRIQGVQDLTISLAARGISSLRLVLTAL